MCKYSYIHNVISIRLMKWRLKITHLRSWYYFVLNFSVLYLNSNIYSLSWINSMWWTLIWLSLHFITRSVDINLVLHWRSNVISKGQYQRPRCPCRRMTVSVSNLRLSLSAFEILIPVLKSRNITLCEHEIYKIILDKNELCQLVELSYVLL